MSHKHRVFLIGLMMFAALLVFTISGRQMGPAPAVFAAGEQMVFEDVTASYGITATHQGFNMLTTGAAWADYDNDGWQDLYVTDTFGPNTLYRNNGDGTFAVSPLSSAVAVSDTVSTGAVWADYDNDGWSDLYVLNDGPNVLWRNLGGTGFQDVTAATGVGDEGTANSGAWGDFDGDGYLDLYVSNYICYESPCPHGRRDTLYRSNGDGTFTDVSNYLDLAQLTKEAFVASWVDYDNDGDLDLYVVPPRDLGNHLWRNDGAGCLGWCFTDVSDSSGAGVQVEGMGLAIGDYDKDGDLDFYFSNAGPQVLLQNQTAQGSPTFVNVGQETGTDFNGTGWGAVFFDYDNDTWPDLYLSTWGGSPETGNRLFHNSGDGTFADWSHLTAADPFDYSMAVAYADFDRDGMLDLVVGERNVRYALYHNMGMYGSANNWLRVKLVGGGPVNRDAIGARVYVTTTDGSTQLQEVKSGSSIGANNELALHFGLGTMTIASATVVWPDGVEESLNNIPLVNRAVTLAYPTFGAALDGAQAADVAPGGTVQFEHVVTNSGNRWDTFDLTTDAPANLVSVAPASVTLRPGGSATVVVTVHIPAAAQPASHSATLTAQSQRDAGATAAVTDTVNVVAP